jgi:hypothetical protein
MAFPKRRTEYSNRFLTKADLWNPVSKQRVYGIKLSLKKEWPEIKISGLAYL